MSDAAPRPKLTDKSGTFAGPTTTSCFPPNDSSEKNVARVNAAIFAVLTSPGGIPRAAVDEYRAYPADACSPANDVNVSGAAIELVKIICCEVYSILSDTYPDTIMSAEVVANLLEELADDSAQAGSVKVSGPAGEVVIPAGSPVVIDTNMPAPAESNDAYLALFDDIANQLDVLGSDIGRISSAGDQDGRLAAALTFIRNQHELNEKLYTLVVEMSNAMGK